MSIVLNTGFSIGSKDLVYDKFVLTKEEMLNIHENTYPDQFFALCSDDDKMYSFNINNAPNAETGKFKVMSGGSTSIDDDNISSTTVYSSEKIDTDFQKITDDNLTTTDKTTTGAINELVTRIDEIKITDIIDDTNTEATDKTLSSSKIKNEIQSIIDDTKYTSTTTYSSKKIENTFAKCQDLIIDEYIIVNNPIGQLTKDTNLYGMNIVDIIKLLVQEEVQPWSGVTVLYGSLSDISSDTIEYASCGLSNDTTTSEIYISESYNLRNEYAVFLCHPGSPVVYIEDQNGFNNTGEFDVKTVTINLPGGNSTRYLMYYTTYRLTFDGEFRYRFYFKEP